MGCKDGWCGRVGWLTDWLVSGWVGRVGWCGRVGWLTDWLVGWLVGLVG